MSTAAPKLPQGDELNATSSGGAVSRSQAQQPSVSGGPYSYLPSLNPTRIDSTSSGVMDSLQANPQQPKTFRFPSLGISEGSESEGHNIQIQVMDDDEEEINEEGGVLIRVQHSAAGWLLLCTRFRVQNRWIFHLPLPSLSPLPLSPLPLPPSLPSLPLSLPSLSPFTDTRENDLTGSLPSQLQSGNDHLALPSSRRRGSSVGPHRGYGATDREPTVRHRPRMRKTLSGMISGRGKGI